MSPRTTSASLPDKPEDWPRQFEEQLNAGDLDGVMELYEPGARFVTRTGETLVGHNAIRKVVSELIVAKMQFHSRVVRAVIVDEIAQLYTDFEGTMVDGSGETVPVRNKAIEVLRRQPDGSWKLIMGTQTDVNEERRRSIPTSQTARCAHINAVEIRRSLGFLSRVPAARSCCLASSVPDHSQKDAKFSLFESLRDVFSKHFHATILRRLNDNGW